MDNGPFRDFGRLPPPTPFLLTALTARNMKITIISDVTPCSVVKREDFRGIICLRVQGRRFLLRKRSQYVPPKRRHQSTELHGVITQTMKAVCSSEMLVLVNQVTRRHIPEGGNVSIVCSQTPRHRLINLVN